MKQAQEIYDDLWNQSRPLFLRNQCEIDPLIESQNDLRRGLTLRIRPSDEIISKIQESTEALRGVAPNQYYTPASDLHLTVLSMVSCHDEFHYDESMDKSYVDKINECVKGISPPLIKFHGLTASPSCILLQGFPENSILAELRNRLREFFKGTSLPNSIDSRYPARTAHVTIMRFQEPQEDLINFARFISENKTREFGTQEVVEMEFVHNGWYHRSADTKIIATFK